MERKLIAGAKIKIDAPLAKVWNALVNPEIIREYMFGTHVISDWKVGSQIIKFVQISRFRLLYG
jgi:uncharacterized protein YndB with AHSA1/START domain